MSDRWLTFEEATEIIRTGLDASVGRSEAILRAARASGEVRFQNPADPVLLLADDGLVGMDLRPGAREKAGLTADGKAIMHRTTSSSGSINKDDLLDWLNRQVPAHKSSDKRMPAKQKAAHDAIRACFPEGPPAATVLPNGPFCTQISVWLKAHRPALAKMNDKTILRAAGRA
jgi:hypothetical protein